MDVDGDIGGFLNEFDAGGLSVGAGDTVGLTFGSLDDQEDAAVVGQGLVQFEGEGLTLADDGGAGGVLHIDEFGRSHGGLASSSGVPMYGAGPTRASLHKAGGCSLSNEVDAGDA